MRTIEKGIVRKKKRIFHEEQMKQAENKRTRKESRRFYWLVNDIRKEFRSHIEACRDSNGLNINETPMIIRRCYATTYNNWGFPALYQGDYLR
jgi:hypothetical protein